MTTDPRANDEAAPRVAAGGRIEFVGFPDEFAEVGWVQDGPIDVRPYRNAFATPFTLIPRPAGPPGFAGALYDSDRALIAASERRVRRGRLPVNPHTIGRRPFAPRLKGEHVYVGMAIQSYGHFLLETLSRLWWVERLEDLAGVRLLLHGWKAYEGRLERRERTSLLKHVVAPFFGPALPVGAAQFLAAPWVSAFLDILGVRRDQVDFVPPTGARLSAVRVPTAVVDVNGGVHRSMPRIYRLIADAVAGDVGAAERRVYLSRARLVPRKKDADGPRRAVNEAALENLLAREGFEIVHPQELSIVEQIRLMRSAAVVAGCDGSALHNVVFARPGTRLLAFDSRAVENQFGIEEASGIVSRHLWMGGRKLTGKAEADWRIDLELVRRNLEFTL